MADLSDQYNFSQRATTAGTIRRIKLENFMCHSSLEIEFGDRVNFITGQNGSGKSAILTALCIAFGSRAKSTNRAGALKDFVKTGCSYASVLVEVKNEGEDAFKREVYGRSIFIERRITDSSTSIAVRDYQGRKISNKKEEVRELVDHFNIDVDNPCVIMSQDKSREFLHSGNAKDKFKFFFKATLLQQVDELLNKIEDFLETAHGFVLELEKSIEPVVKELTELQEKIKNMEHIEELAERIKEMKFKLAWSWVYNVDRDMIKQRSIIDKRKSHISTCEAEINQRLEKIEGLRSSYANMKNRYEQMTQKNSEVKIKQDDLQENLSAATKYMFELEDEHRRKMSEVQKLMRHVKSLEQKIHDIEEQNLQNTQAEESEMQYKLKALLEEVDAADALLMRLNEEENAMSDSLQAKKEELGNIVDQIEVYERKVRETKANVSELQRHQTNKVTAYGGEKVIQLLRIIESRYRDFEKPPIGPIGVHLTLSHGDEWAFAVENAVGKLLNAFIVTSVKDSHILRSCARQARYDYLQIIIYDFSIPRYNIPLNQLPQTSHPTTLSVLQSDSATVINVLVDKGGAERQVLVKDYDIGKNVAFDKRVANLKEVYTAEGVKMFSRGSVQTVLPPNKRARTGRLCSSYDDQIKELEREAMYMREQSQKGRQLKRAAEEEAQDLHEKLKNVKRRRLSVERQLDSKKLAFEDLKRTITAEASGLNASSADEILDDISRVKAEIQGKESLLEKLEVAMTEAREKVSNLKSSLGLLHESANEDIVALNKAEEEFVGIAKELDELEATKLHYEKVLNEKVLPGIQQAEAKLVELEQNRKESYEKASFICPESDVEALGGCKESIPEQLSAQLARMIQRLERAKDKCTESIDDLRMLYEQKQRKILKKQRTFENFREQLQVAQRALDSRRAKFNRNASILKRLLTWHFNGHLGKKGISGSIDVKYEEKTLSIQVTMPQDASRTSIQDTRGLSGGERSFSTLCFALALHQMTEAPFRAMDEFDVFMDAVSRKISLDTVVDFALEQGSQWIFITPHDISMVKQDERVRKQQMAAPRS
ncbi:structural maintenance of chromosomes protein 6B-like isoform X2 [Silene latifolia]|uniref:structural maintenance of chromosomes protein 6B-like isoform X2 n=1 Tax=Silene latifolia TaxID=37657 RepID=UPI003D787D82